MITTVTPSVFLNGGKWFSPNFLELELIIAVDGAYDYLLDCGLNVERITHVIGDFDSTQRTVPVEKQLKRPNQDFTDFEKCIQWLIESGYQRAIIYFAEGGELDHFLANLHVAVKYHQQIDLDFYAKTQHYTILKDEKLYLEAKQLGLNVSVMPFPEVVVSSDGLRYSLKDTPLELGNAISVRNCNSDGNCFIEVKGQAVVFFATEFSHSKLSK